MTSLFLDLENTIITPVVQGWSDVELINIDKISHFIAAQKISDIHIFSFAIHGQEDFKAFHQHCLPILESALKMKVGRIPTVYQDIIPACANQKGIAIGQVDFNKMKNFWSKDLAFILCMQEWFKFNNHSQKIFLLDDMVQDYDVHLYKRKLELHLLNIDALN